MLFDMVVTISLVYPEVHTAVNRRVRGDLPRPLELLDFRNVSVK